jgi:SepF-like predicted cell division protein (DUF552 family)
VLPKFGDVFGRLLSRLKQQSGIGETPEPKESIAGEEGEKREPVTSQPEPLPVRPEKVYLKALPLRDLADLDAIKEEVKSGNILILKVSPLAKKSLDDVKAAVDQLLEFTRSMGGDIARLGEERVVITPTFVRIWREKKAAPGETVPTAA